MNNQRLYSISGIFNTPDNIINAASKVADAGYNNYDVNTPYPVHGMDRAMKLSPSKMGYFALVLGLTGTTTALLFMWLTTAYDYPLVIGGKPFFSLPALIPITFEVTVLMATIGTVLSMLFIFFKLPNNSHPLHDTDYIKKVSSDKFGIIIEARDPLFDADKVKVFLSELGAVDIEEIYFDEDERSFKNNIFNKKFLGFVTVVFLLVSGATYVVLNIVIEKPPFDWMRYQSKIIAQGTSQFFGGAGMQDPVEGTVARGNLPYFYKGEPEKAGEALSNPLEVNEENLTIGKKKYNTFCSPCHDYYGTGQSRLNQQFPNPPSLHTNKLRDWTDGRIFHVISDGQNVMPAYDKQINETERWQIVLYVRALQRAMNAKEEDLK